MKELRSRFRGMLLEVLLRASQNAMHIAHVGSTKALKAGPCHDKWSGCTVTPATSERPDCKCSARCWSSPCCEDSKVLELTRQCGHEIRAGAAFRSKRLGASSAEQPNSWISATPHPQQFNYCASLGI